jgi:hypothetical protein
MSEKIRELEKLCWNDQTNHLDAEKFARMIIAECTGICEDLGTEGDGQHCVDAINNYFSNKKNT